MPTVDLRGTLCREMEKMLLGKIGQKVIQM
jgi:hypothetical protein